MNLLKTSLNELELDRLFRDHRDDLNSTTVTRIRTAIDGFDHDTGIDLAKVTDLVDAVRNMSIVRVHGDEIIGYCLLNHCSFTRGYDGRDHYLRIQPQVFTASVTCKDGKCDLHYNYTDVAEAFDVFA